MGIFSNLQLVLDLENKTVKAMYTKGGREILEIPLSKTASYEPLTDTPPDVRYILNIDSNLNGTLTVLDINSGNVISRAPFAIANEDTAYLAQIAMNEVVNKSST